MARSSETVEIQHHDRPRSDERGECSPRARENIGVRDFRSVQGPDAVLQPAGCPPGVSAHGISRFIARFVFPFWLSFHKCMHLLRERKTPLALGKALSQRNRRLDTTRRTPLSPGNSLLTLCFATHTHATMCMQANGARAWSGEFTN
ncbi:hypothetical protein TGVAND_357080 [Toxoplasma gondii VAND]|uniref:Uncharacterized protein n=3 Tax=Toxoplasma gondii TaxID=5811 RepID=V4Z717_TOXGV|nr:hypothetical protein TGVEG_357080 [Toxoplasma gondii VEG]KFG43783.1 hypothetical protein TGP89_357080 [Toxoplasma gondii p89]KFH03943.1 hypothetical protein TGVAND_357080 [Toxoplasma gondii VAND]